MWLAVLDQGIVDTDLRRTLLPRLTAPTLLIWGRQQGSHHEEEEERQTLREGLPHARVKIFEGLGHNPLWEDPQACAVAINTFLSSAANAAARAK